MTWRIVIILILIGRLIPQTTAGTISGKVTDEQNRPLPGVAVYIPNTPYGTTTNEMGYFHLTSIPPGTYTLTFDLLGYQTLHQNVIIAPGQRVQLPQIILKEAPLQANPVVVTATRHETHLSDVPVSAAVLPRSQIRQRTSIFLNQALQYIPGITLNGGQLNIRGSTGYTRGVGSRVLLLVDGLPLLTSDTREVNYDVIPTYFIEQVEVLKGAGSALYGSGAMGGVINVQTRRIKDLPSLWLESYGGIYTSPTYKEWQWSQKRQWLNGQLAGIAGTHSNMGMAIVASRDEDQSYRQNDWRRRWQITSKIELSPNNRHQLSVVTSWMQQHRANFLFWKNLRYALQPPEEQLGNAVQSRRGFMLARYQFFPSTHNILEAKGSWFYNHFEDNIGGMNNGNQSTATEGYLEIQYTHQRKKHLLIAGGNVSRGQVTSNLFGNRTLTESAVFFQDEWQPHSTLKVTLGIRGDGYRLDTLQFRGRVSLRFATLLRWQEKHRWRIAAGSGFRSPSLAEVFTTTSASGLTVVPNPRLYPESNWGGELGYRYQNHRGYLDLALFYQRYQNLIEPTFQSSINIQFQNVVQAQIVGLEGVVHHSFLNQRLLTQLGYTYVDAHNLENGNFLNFRPRHTLYLQIQTLFPWGLVQTDYRYVARYDQIDPRLALFITDVDRYNAAHVVDVSISTHFPKWLPNLQVNFTIKNILNYYYTDLVGSLAPLRHYILTLRWEK